MKLPMRRASSKNKQPVDLHPSRYIIVNLLIYYSFANTKKAILMSSLAAATNPALNKSESPGKKKPISKPVSTKIIPAITT